MTDLIYDEHGNAWRRSERDETLYPVPDPAHITDGGRFGERANVAMADALMGVFGFRRVDKEGENGGI